VSNIVVSRYIHTFISKYIKYVQLCLNTLQLIYVLSPIVRTCASTNSKYRIRSVVVHFTFIKPLICI
jgi:hypothetical protein